MFVWVMPALVLALLISSNAILFKLGKKSIEDRDSLLFECRQEVLYSASLRDSDLQVLINSIKHFEIMKYDLLILLPPYPCQGCIDTQVKLLTDNLPDCVYEEIAVITPEIRSRDMKTAFSSLNNVDYYQYQESDYVVESPLISATGIILSRMDSGRVHDIFASSKFYPESTLCYIR